MKKRGTDPYDTNIRGAVIFCLVVCEFFFLLLIPHDTHAAAGQVSVYLSPAQGTFEVGETFDLSFFVNTAGNSINAVKLDVAFPPGKLQVADPAAGTSFISMWVVPPEYSNTAGSVSLQGGIPNPGLNTSAGLITTVTFRATSPGDAYVSVLDSSRVLANDGFGTDVLALRGQAIVYLTIPAPEGPEIVSTTHPDQNTWYQNHDPQLSWVVNNPLLDLGAEYAYEYSWKLNKEWKYVPDNEAEGLETSAYYEGLECGVWYFHVKAKAEGMWGKTSHYVIRIDRGPPASFTPVVEPELASEDVPRVATFGTTDAHSGVDRYEVKVESITDDTFSNAFYTEQSSPYLLPVLPEGEYVIFVKAIDNAGNVREEQTTFVVGFGALPGTSYGVVIGDRVIPWWGIGLGILVIASAGVFVFWLMRRRKKHSSPPPKGERATVVEHLNRKLTSYCDKRKHARICRQQEKKKMKGEKKVPKTATKKSKKRKG